MNTYKYIKISDELFDIVKSVDNDESYTFVASVDDKPSAELIVSELNSVNRNEKTNTRTN